jgi:hypothetical protein
MESGTVFDTNVYDKGDAMPIKGVESDPVILEAQSRAEVGNDAIQDVAALVKVRRYMPNDEKDNPTKSTAWDQYVIRVQGAMTDEGQRAAFVARTKAVRGLGACARGEDPRAHDCRR